MVQKKQIITCFGSSPATSNDDVTTKWIQTVCEWMLMVWLMFIIGLATSRWGAGVQGPIRRTEVATSPVSPEGVAGGVHVSESLTPSPCFKTFYNN